ncbi:N-acetylmuramoyl-L-alanine amidase family protein [Candidatus Protochlamydia phocaeensis]|uniref:N-acetylmuramoyl-L-alanine amidase family protein n=1 Tax=Candidatus Protochlamydia phocaeensis TaxID=1414722 RepID=UPI00083904A5|nr:N-acetylmuramoyl-L-alanine amidase [Candidatus Protochlamydia phocaeensis]
MSRLISLFSLIWLVVLSNAYAQPLYRSNASLAKPGSIPQLGPKELANPVKPPLLVQKSLIVIDPGHGGHDVGTQSISKPRYQEKSLNLVTAQFVRGFLQQLGYQVIMTREDDTFVSLEKRAQLANEKKPALFVSIHYNSAPSAQAQGIEVYFYQSKEKKMRAQKSKRLAQAILKNTVAETQAKSRGVKHGNYAVIRETTMPAILIEGGFVTNEAEMKNLKDPTYLKSLAWGIVKGIDEYTEKNKGAK